VVKREDKEMTVRDVLKKLEKNKKEIEKLYAFKILEKEEQLQNQMKEGVPLFFPE